MATVSAVRLALATALLLVGCDSVVAPGEGTIARSAPTGAPSTGSQPTSTSEPPGTSTPTETDDPSEPSTPATPATTSPGGTGDAALAAAVGFLFAAEVNEGDLAGAYALLCPEDQAEVTLEDFSEDAPAPGTLSFELGEQLGPGEFVGTITFEGESEDILVRSDDAGGFCLSDDT